MLNKFDFDIKYIKYKENIVVDALNKIEKMNFILVISSYGIGLQERIKNVE